MAEDATPEETKPPYPPRRRFFGLHAISTWWVETRQAPSRHCRAREGLRQVYGLPTTATHAASKTPAAPVPTLMLQFTHRPCSINSSLQSLSHDITHRTIAVHQPKVVMYVELKF